MIDYAEFTGLAGVCLKTVMYLAFRTCLDNSPSSSTQS